MLTLKIGDKELQIKYGYEATIKSRLLSNLAKKTAVAEVTEDNNLTKVEDMLLFLPEMLLIGLQKYHKDEYGFNYDSAVEKEGQRNKMFELIDDYCDIEGNDSLTLFEALNNELTENGFLASLFRQEVEKAEQKVISMPHQSSEI